MSARSKESSSPTVEPKKSARLAQKRKLREEASLTPVSDEDCYFQQSNVGPKGSCNEGSTMASSPPLIFKEEVPSSLDPSSATSTITTKRVVKIAPHPHQRVPSLVRPTPERAELGQQLTSIVWTKTGLSGSSAFILQGNSTSELLGDATALPLSLNVSSSSNFTNVPKKILTTTTPTTTLTSQDLDLPIEDKWLAALELDSEKLVEFDDEVKMIQTLKQSSTSISDKDSLASLFADPTELQTFCLEADVDHKSEKWVALTEEMIRRRTEKSEYIRLHISDEQYNQNKTTTGQEDTSCLANTQDGLQNQPNRKTDSSIIFIRKPEGTTITFPHGMEIPIRKTVAPLLHPTVTKCSVLGCLSDKKYSCSLTKVPLCSLSCYKKNLEKYNSVTKL